MKKANKSSMTRYELYKRNIKYIGYLEGEFEQQVFLDEETLEIILEVKQDEEFWIVATVKENDIMLVWETLEKMYENFYTE